MLDLELESSSALIIKTTSQNIWELDANVDIILFINMETMYIDGLEDNIIERVNARFPFKDR